MKSEVGKELLKAIQAQVRESLGAVDALNFNRGLAAAKEAKDLIKDRQPDPSIDDEDTLNDQAVLVFLARFLSEYVTFWEKVSNRDYEPSWMALQDCLDLIRLMKRVSQIDLTRFETQLKGLESVYPYRLFASIGCIAGWVECSICGHDIDSFECVHRRGELYRGKMACGIVRELKQMDHVALTENPEDKRCIMKMEGTIYQFPAIDWLADHLTTGKFKVSDFHHVEMTTRRKRNEKVVRQERNDPCQCGSGKKFKQCCGVNEFTTYPHAEFICRSRKKGQSLNFNISSV